MKARFLLPLALGLAVWLTPATTVSAADGPRTIAINAGNEMKFDVTTITAKPGEEIKVTLTNKGTMPIDAMGHNWVLLTLGSDAAAFATAAQTAKDKGYIPEAKKDEIVAKIDMLGPNKTGEVTFKAPDKPGDYPFLCTFPAHFLVGMKGVLTVK
jgi:azurin